MGEAANNARQKIEDYKTHIAISIFHVIGEDPHKKHIADEMHPTAMQEHGGDQCKRFRNAARGRVRMEQFNGCEAKTCLDAAQYDVIGESPGEQEDHDIEHNDAERHKLKAYDAQMRVVMKGQEHNASLADQQFEREPEHDDSDDGINGAPNNRFG